MRLNEKPPKPLGDSTTKEVSSADPLAPNSNEQVDTVSNHLTFDNFLKLVGKNGRFQAFYFVFCCLSLANVNYQNTSTVFTQTTPKHRCEIPGVDNTTYIEMSVDNIKDVTRYIPTTDTGELSNCEVFLINTTHQTGYNRSTQYVGLDPRRTKCSRWVYDTSVMKRTLVSDLDLVCANKVVRSHANMVLFVGKVIAAFIQGYISDRFGRRITLIMATLGLLSMNILSAFVYNELTLLLARFLTGFFGTAQYLAMFVLAMEFFSINQRSKFSVLCYMIGGVSFGSMGLLAYLIRDWVYFQLALAWTVVPCTFLMWLIPESPRWSISQQRVHQVEKTLQTIAKMNGKSIPSGLAERMCAHMDYSSKPSVFQLFSDTRLIVRWCILYLNWIAMCMANFGLYFNISNMKGNIFVNFAIGGALDALSCLVISPFVNKLSRRYLFASLMSFSGLACIATFIPILLNASTIWVIALSLIGKAMVNAAYPVMYTFSSELYPTPYRSSGVGSCSLMSRVGGLLSPYVADLNLYASGRFADVLPQLVFGLCTVCGGLTVLALPETRGRELPETVEDIKNYSVPAKKSFKTSEVNSV